MSRLWHLITGEFPPQPGGVSDYSYLLAKSLAAEGDEVHVWRPPTPLGDVNCPGVSVHWELGAAGAEDLKSMDRALTRFPGPRQILVQWVPHAYGFRSMNVGFCLWLWRRARRGDRVDLMVHEPFLSFGEGSWRQDAAAVVHRFMTIILLRAANRVWVSIPFWERRLRKYSLGRKVPFAWLPIPSSIPVIHDLAGVRALRSRYTPGGELIIGHFGTYGPSMAPALDAIFSRLGAAGFAHQILLLGAGGDGYRERLEREQPSIAARVHATGALSPDDVSRHLSACDLLVQPYIDGVSGRRSSFMAGLSHGRPMVTTTGPATEAIWGQSGAVAMVAFGDWRACVETVERLCADEQERTRLGDAARKLYQERFDLAHVVARLRQVEDRETTCAA